MDEEKEFNKKEAQILSFQLLHFVQVLRDFSYYDYDYECMGCVILMIKHINKIADRLYSVLNCTEVFEEVLIGDMRKR